MTLAMRNATLKDVAARAGVSTATVSRVLHENGYVSADARERVEVALRESGYRLNTVAQELRRQRTIALGLIIHGLSNPFFAEIVAGAEHAAAEQDFNVLLFNTRGAPERERRNVETLLRRRVDGILFTEAVGPESVRCAVDAGVAVVEMGQQLDERTSAIVIDDYVSAREAVEHLLALGHREIAYLGVPWGLLEPPPPLPVGGGAPRMRFEAYRDALAAAGIPLREALLVHGEYPREEGGWPGPQTGAEAMARLLEQAPMLTAVFAASDLAAAGALQTLYRRGVRVPDDVSVVGIDDTYAPHLTPPLTSVHHRPFEMGFQAATMAIELVDGGAPRTQRLPLELAVRESTAPPSRGAAG
jgi:DNA-binding LacI/PurR family transcriptional regulator